MVYNLVLLGGLYMLDISKVNCGTVLIANRIHSRDDMNRFQRNLEFSSDTMFYSLKNALENVSLRVTCYTSIIDFIDNIHLHKNDIILTTIWSGMDSRNRRIYLPAICESYGLTYVGADAYVQALSADKVLSKTYCAQYGIPSAKSVTITKLKEYGLLSAISYPAVVKPNFEGGSIGISDKNIVDTADEACKLSDILLTEYETLIVEEYLEGQEVAACIVGSGDNIDLFEIVEISLDEENYFSHRILGYESKKGKHAHQERKVITEQIDLHIQEKLKKVFLGLGKVDFMRIDGRLKNGVFSLLELTPDCSLHPDCFMYKAFSHQKYSYTDMIACLLNQALAKEKKVK